MTVQTRASAKIEYSRRDVYISCHPGQTSGPLAEPIARRLRNNLDEDTSFVHWFTSENWKPGQLQKFLEEVSDIVVLLDDDIISGFKAARLEQITDLGQPGLELLAVLKVNDARSATEEAEPARVWLAKAETIDRLIGLKKVAGRPEWNLDERNTRQELHWFYDEAEKVLTDMTSLRDKKFFGADETRMGRNVGRFVDHEPEVCTHCGQAHARR